MNVIKPSLCVIALVASLAIPAAAQAHADAGLKGAKAACADVSKTPVTGQMGTPFSRCVVSAAQAHKSAHVSKAASAKAKADEHAAVAAAQSRPDQGINGAKAGCALLSKEHVAGEHGTAFSRCVIAVAQAEKSAHAARVAAAKAARAAARAARLGANL